MEWGSMLIIGFGVHRAEGSFLELYSLVSTVVLV